MLVKLEGTGYGGGVFRTNFIGRCSKITDLKGKIVEELLPSWSQEDFYVEYNGKVLREDGEVAALFGEVGVGNASKRVSIVPRVLGGKGGFGSMLRAIGAQIEKTTNRDACRDLSGRRLRDIDEQKRLVKWFEKQAKREIERREARERKLEKLRKVAAGPPLPKIEDQQFLQQRQEIMDAGFDAVDEAFREGPSETDALATHKDSSNSTSPSTSNLQSLLETGPGKETRMCASASTNEYATGSASITNVKEPKPVKKTLFDEDLESDGTSSEDSEEDKR